MIASYIIRNNLHEKAAFINYLDNPLRSARKLVNRIINPVILPNVAVHVWLVDGLVKLARLVNVRNAFVGWDEVH